MKYRRSAAMRPADLPGSQRRDRANTHSPSPRCDFYEGCSPGLNLGSWLVRADQFRRRQPDEHAQECPYHAAESSHADSPGFGRALASSGGRPVVRGFQAHGVQMAGAVSRAWRCRVAGSLVGGTASSACLVGGLDCADSTVAARQTGGGGDRPAIATGADPAPVSRTSECW